MLRANRLLEMWIDLASHNNGTLGVELTKPQGASRLLSGCLTWISGVYAREYGPSIRKRGRSSRFLNLQSNSFVGMLEQLLDQRGMT